MSLPRYPAYKASGIDWLSHVPEEWGIVTGRRIFLRARDAALPDDEQLSATQKYGVVPQTLFMELEGQQVVQALSGTSGFQHVEPGDFVISLRSFQGGIETSRHRGCVSPAYTVLRARREINTDYWSYLLKSEGYVSRLQSLTDGIRDGKAISYQQFGLVEVPVPPIEDQKAIAAFLDRETTKTDALIAEQNRLIELLKEKRHAVISHVVSKGLDPSAPMKPSGVEWLGDVPAHWSVAPIGYRYEVALGKMLDQKRITGDHLAPYLRNADVQWGHIRTRGLNEMDFPPEDRERYSLRKGDLLVCEGGEVGRCAIWRGEVAECYYQKALHRLRPYDPLKDTPEHLKWVFFAAAHSGAFAADETKATIAHLPAEKLRRQTFPMPPPAEQLEIAAFLDKETGNADALIAEAQRAIDLLQERRAALISAAVTGQIDVRGLAAKVAA